MLERLREELGLYCYSLATEETYVDCVRIYILFHDKRYPEHLGVKKVTQFLPWLTAEHRILAATKYQAKAATLFLHAQVPKTP